MLMAACRGRDTGPRPNHSILPSHGGAGQMAACRGGDHDKVIQFCQVISVTVFFLQCRGQVAIRLSWYNVVVRLSWSNVVVRLSCSDVVVSHGRAGLMVASNSRDTGPQPDHSILPSHGSAELMVACCADI